MCVMLQFGPFEQYLSRNTLNEQWLIVEYPFKAILGQDVDTVYAEYLHAKNTKSDIIPAHTNTHTSSARFNDLGDLHERYC